MESMMNPSPRLSEQGAENNDCSAFPLNALTSIPERTQDHKRAAGNFMAQGNR
ncbi:hypothetical protein [Streptomyces cuspidosporus]|uniref:hypothetical protein n=1 Tax=Streptomyces cuspidosporus TaxID=66882 RepID=UPI0031FCA7D1